MQAEPQSLNRIVLLRRLSELYEDHERRQDPQEHASPATWDLTGDRARRLRRINDLDRSPWLVLRGLRAGHGHLHRPGKPAPSGHLRLDAAVPGPAWHRPCHLCPVRAGSKSVQPSEQTCAPEPAGNGDATAEAAAGAA